MAAANAPSILFAPVLKAESWTSIELQQQNILDALQNAPGAPEVAHVRVPQALAEMPVGKQLVRDYLYPAAIRREVRRQPAVVLHVTDHGYGHLCRAHRPCVVNCNDLHHLVDPDLRGATLARWKQRVFGMRHADRILAISDHLAAETRELLGVSADRVVGLPGGVDTSVFRPFDRVEAAALLPELAALRHRHILVLNIGSNMRLKNLPTLLRALAILRQPGQPPWKLIKIGAPLHTSEHAALIRELGVAEDIIDLGMQPAAVVAAACRLGHVLSFPSLYEGFGRPTLEAQACELPCVLADTSGMREIGGTGALYHAPRDPESLADALMRAASDSPVRERLIDVGRANAARFTWKRYAERLIEIYCEVAH